MPEKVLSLPLAGDEIIESIVDKVRTSLRKDCFLSPTTAYGFYEAKITLSVKLHDIGRMPEVNQEVKVSEGAEPVGDDVYLEQADAEIEIGEQPPNEVRVESNQPVPVLSTKDGRPEINRVRYSKKQIGKAKNANQSGS